MLDGFMEQEKVWDAIALSWQKFRDVEVSRVSDFLKDKSGKVLDLGCGSGRNFSKGDEFEFYGVDFSQKMVDLAKKTGIAKEVRKARVSAVPYDDGFFDYVIFSAVLHCVDSAAKRKKAIEEVHRVLKRGGEALVSVWGRGQGRLKNKGKEGFVPWTVGDKKVQRYTYIYDFDELKIDLEGAGFKIIGSWEDECVGFIVRKK